MSDSSERRAFYYRELEEIMKNVYIASSWRNKNYENVLEYVRQFNVNVYDFKIPENAFHWSEIDPDWKKWTSQEMVKALEHPLAIKGYVSDFSALKNCDMLILVMPCGRSAHLEAGFVASKEKPVIVLLADGEPELMYKMLARPFCHCLADLDKHLKILESDAR